MSEAVLLLEFARQDSLKGIYAHLEVQAALDDVALVQANLVLDEQVDPLVVDATPQPELRDAARTEGGATEVNPVPTSHQT